MDDCDEASVARALYLIAELDGMSRVASKCGLSVNTMRRQLNGTRPLYFDTVLGVMRARGFGCGLRWREWTRYRRLT